MRPQNLLFIFSDQHAPEFLGCAGHPHVRTPHLDALAARGTRFLNATTPSPVCVPARASLATGRHVHDIRFWDNGQAYDGSVRSWGHPLIERGHRVAAIGKLHYRSDEDDNGFSEKIGTMNVVDGVGDRIGWLRGERLERGACKDLAGKAGRGESTYTEYDRRTTASAEDWLRRRATETADKPWVLFVGFVMPHLPLIAPDEFYDLYAGRKLRPPRLYGPGERPRHPWIDELTHAISYDRYFDDRSRTVAIEAYHGMVSFLDHNIGRVLQTLEASGLGASTRVLYTSDHGEMLGNHGIWGKCCMYQESAGVPMIMAGEGVPAGATTATEASLVDCYPTVLGGLGVPLTEAETQLPGRSLFDLAVTPDPARVGFSQYHGIGSKGGAFMVRRGRWKYVYYPGSPPQLFDLDADPTEARDLGTAAGHAAIRAEMDAELRKIIDPEAANTLAFADQAERIAENGGADAIMARGEFGYTPTPDETPTYERAIQG